MNESRERNMVIFCRHSQVSLCMPTVRIEANEEVISKWWAFVSPKIIKNKIF